MVALLNRSHAVKRNRNRASTSTTARKLYLEALESRQLLSAVAPPVQTFYLPVPADSVLTALKTIHKGPKAPVSTYASIAVAKDGTQIYYDQWENGFAADISQPTGSEIYDSITNPAGVQIWGDGDLSNGAAPGFADDVLHSGDIIVLRSPAIAVPRDPSQIYFDGRDKIAATKSVAIGELHYATGTSTLLAGALQVNPTSGWGTTYSVPVGQNTAGSKSMFKYTGLAIMAARDGTTVRIDLDGNGRVDKTVTLNEGEAYLVNNGVKQGATVTSTDLGKPIQVNVITGNPSQQYASRWFSLTPIGRWSNSYYTPVSTRASDATGIFLYNPSATAITVTGVTRGSAGAADTLTTVSIKVSARGSAKVMLPDGSGAHFYTQGGQPFYAISTTDFGGCNYDWGMSLLPENQLTTQAIVGLGFGRDPLSNIRLQENGSPVWVTPTGNGNTAETIYVDFNGDDEGPLTDPNGFHYDVALSLKELQRAKVFDPDGGQTGMLLYTLNSHVKLAVSWGEDPSSASISSPGVDAGTNVDPLPEFDAGKSASLLVDANGDGVVSPGDTLLYTIVVNNASRTLRGDLTLTDTLPSTLSYVPNTATYTITTRNGFTTAPVAMSDAGTTAFPLDEGGETLPLLPGGATYTVTFQATIADTLPLGVTEVVNTGMVSSPRLDENVPIEARTPVQFNVQGLVFEDTNRNGAVDADESGLVGVTVNFLNGATTVATATTDASGHYLFIAPPLGTYTVDIDDATLLAVLPNSEQTAGVDPSLVTLNGGGAITDAGIDGYSTNFGAIPSSLSGRVTVDGAGKGGVLITLTGADIHGTIAPRTVTTALDGTYAFPGLLAGTYTLTESQPAGLLDGTDSAGSLGGTAAVIPGDQIINIVLPGATSGVNYNFTEISPATISGFVYEDVNNNGLKDGPDSPTGSNTVGGPQSQFEIVEPQLGGVTLTLTGTNDLGPIVPITITTDPDGSYTFGNLRPGTYTVTEFQPEGYLDGTDAKGNVIIPDSHISDEIDGLTLSPGASAAAIFGELPPAEVSGFVYVDANNNGVKDNAEAPIGGVLLTLTGENDLGDIAPITVSSAVDGSYSFGLLRPGTYAVAQAQPAGYFDGKDSQGGVVIAGSNTTDLIGEITLNADGIFPENNFGELLAASASGLVYVDANNNGTRDNGEAPLDGALLTLTGSNDLGAIAPIAITSAADGSFSFANLRPGTYTISETQPAGYVDGFDAGNGAVIVGSESTDVITGIVLGSGSNAGKNTFGELIASIKLVKTANTSFALVGEAVTYSYAMTNTGSAPFAAANVTVVDDNATLDNLADDFHPNPVLAGAFKLGDTNSNNRLDGGETWQFQATLVPPAPLIIASPLYVPVINVAVASATAGIMTVTDTATAQVILVAPDLAVVKTADSANIVPGAIAGFTVTISNIGTAAALNVKLSDPLPDGTAGSLTWTIDSTVGNPSAFIISGSQGSQVLTLNPASGITLAAGATLSVHITSPTSAVQGGGDVGGAFIGLGAASSFAILGLSGGDVTINSATSITGNVGYSSSVTSHTNQKVDSFDGSAFIQSTADVQYTAATFAPSGGIKTGSAADLLLTQANVNALALSAAFASAPSTNLGALTGNTLLVSTGATNVYTVSSVNLNSQSITFQSRPGFDDVFVINVLGSFDFSQSKILLTNGTTADHVLFNFPNASNISVNKASTVFNGTILAPIGTVNYHNPATFNGAIIARNIDVHSDFNISNPMHLAALFNVATVSASNEHQNLTANNVSSATINFAG